MFLQTMDMKELYTSLCCNFTFFLGLIFQLNIVTMLYLMMMIWVRVGIKTTKDNLLLKIPVLVARSISEDVPKPH